MLVAACSGCMCDGGELLGVESSLSLDCLRLFPGVVGSTREVRSTVPASAILMDDS